MKRSIVVGIVSLAAAVFSTAADARLVSFRSPSGNIGCMGETATSRNMVRCDVSRHSFRAPAKPASCDFDWGSSLSVGRTCRTRWNCISDSALGSRNVLRYGTSRTIGAITCRSSRLGMRCTNRVGHGFFVSRASAYRF